MTRSRALPRAAAALACALLSSVTHAGEWMQGDRVALWRGCHSAASVEAIAEHWEAGVTAIPRPPEDCFQVLDRSGERGHLPAVLVEQIGREYAMPDGTRLVIWRVVDAQGDTPHITLAADAGPHEGI